MLQYTTVDRVLGKLAVELRGSDLNETDIIEWIGEAMDFLSMPEIQEEAVAFMEVKNFEVPVPDNLIMILQLSKYNKEKEDICESCKQATEKEVEEECPDCDEESAMDCIFYDLEYRPYFDMQWQYIPWTVSHYYKERFSPIRLSNHTFFNSIVCKEKNLYSTDCCEYEYTIVGTTEKKLRFSFQEGYVALSYIKSAIDSETGYPLIPDNVRHITAITYYVKWKIAEYNTWNGREGFRNLAQDSENKWLKYVKQAKNWTKMPKTVDQFQNLLEQSHYLIPRHNRYYKYFGNLGKAEKRKFNDPDNRNLRYYGE